MLPQGVTGRVLWVFEQRCFPLIFFPPAPTQNGGKSSLSPGSSKYLGSSMRDTAAEERGRQRGNLDFLGEYSVELDLRKQKENVGIAALGQTKIHPSLRNVSPGTLGLEATCLAVPLDRTDRNPAQCLLPFSSAAPVH